MQAVTVTILIVHMGKRGTEKLRNCPKWTPGPRQGKETFLDVMIPRWRGGAWATVPDAVLQLKFH